MGYRQGSNLGGLVKQGTRHLLGGGRGRGREGDEEGGFEYGNKLAFKRCRVSVPERLPEGKGETLAQFEAQARVQYRKGEGVAGQAWARGAGEMHWQDLHSIPDDDDSLAEDPRMLSAKALFDLVVALPLPDARDAFASGVRASSSGDVRGVLVMYRNGNSHGLRPNENVRQLSERKTFTSLLSKGREVVSSALLLEDMRPAWRSTLGKPQLKDDEEEAAAERQDDGPKASLRSIAEIKSAAGSYLQRWRGKRVPVLTGHGLEFAALAFLGVLVSLAALAQVDLLLRKHTSWRDDTLFALVASFGALAMMLFASPTSPLVQPRSVIGGHLIAVPAAIALDYLVADQYLGFFPQWLAVALIPGLAVVAMCLSGLIHPPAVACAIIYLEGGPEVKNARWMFLAVPVLLDSILMLCLALLINNASRTRQYPLYW